MGKRTPRVYEDLVNLIEWKIDIWAAEPFNLLFN